MKLKYTLLALAVMTGATNAAGIIAGSFGAGGSIGATDSAGFVPSDDWNNLSGLSGAAIALNDDDGAASGSTVTWTVSEEWTVGGTPPVADPGSGTLMNGFFSNNTGAGSPQLITVSSIPYAIYDLYIYSSHDRTTGRTITTFSEQGGAFASTTISEDVDGAAVGADPFVFNAVTAGTSGTGNYVKFSGLTAGTLDIDFVTGNGDAGNQDRTGFAGFQIVQVPEPSTALLGGLGMLALLRRRRH
jgi:hypothetical protein